MPDTNKSLVALIPCDNYDEEKVYDAISKGIELIGGLDSLINKDEKILVKPNLLSGSNPSKAITTNPSVFGSILKYLREKGYQNITYGDSPAGVSNMEEVVKVAELKEQADKYDVKLGDFDNYQTVNNPNGHVAKKFALCKGVVDADAIISVSKMKTHALENITGAVKNQYGCIFSNKKSLGHAKYPNSNIFARMLADLNLYLKPRLFIMDGIIAMEGNGPASGNPIFMKTILISKDPVALDSVFARLVDLKPEYVPTIVYGDKYKLGTMDFNNISVVTPDGEITIDDAFKKYGNPNFDVNRKKRSFWSLKEMFHKSKEKSHRPVVNLDLCIACGKCEGVCPVDGKAVHSGNGNKAKYDYSKCIRCYCCQEICPAKAISREG